MIKKRKGSGISQNDQNSQTSQMPGRSNRGGKNDKNGRTEKADEPIDGDNVFVRIRPMISKPEDQCKIEAHKYYADIHYVAAGSEVIGYADTHTLTEVSYDEAKDAYLLEGRCDYITLEEG